MARFDSRRAPVLRITKEEFRNFINYIQKHCGILLQDKKEYLIESRLKDLVLQNGCKSFGALLIKAKTLPHTRLRDRIVDAITTKETFWFRDGYPFTILKEKILPEYAEHFQSGKRLKIWSMACSTGQEPYSIAMAIHDFCRKKAAMDPGMFEILATDISPSALFLAMNGSYDRFTIARGLPTEMRKRHFTQERRVFSISEEIKKMVTFKKFNLQDSFSGLGRFDVVFCRNVAIYFSADFKKEIFKKIAGVLKPRGNLILGGAESISHYSTIFNRLTYKKGPYYELGRSL
ncbi:CheR family methyltransferase [Fibrobacterota bacterium]